MKYKPMWAIIRGTLGVYAMPRTPNQTLFNFPYKIAKV